MGVENANTKLYTSFWRTSQMIPTWPSKNSLHNSLFRMKRESTTSILTQNNKVCNGTNESIKIVVSLHCVTFFHIKCRQPTIAKMFKIFITQKLYCACRVLSLATIKSKFYFNFILNRTRSGRELFDRPSYMGDGFYRSKDPTNSIKVLKEHIGHRQIKRTISRHINTKHSNPLVYTNMWWLGDGSHRGQVRHAWTAVGLPPWYADYSKLRDINNELLRLLNCLGVFLWFKQHWYPGRSVGRTGSGSWTDNATSQSCQATSEEGAIINFASRFRDAEAESDLRTSDGGLLGTSTQLTKCYLIV